VGICVAVLVVGVVSRPFLINVNQFKPVLESDLRSTRTRTTGNGATGPYGLIRRLRNAGDLRQRLSPEGSPISAAQAFDSGSLASVVSRNIWGLLNSSKPLSLD
jgi:hypothetical protein